MSHVPRRLGIANWNENTLASSYFSKHNSAAYSDCGRRIQLSRGTVLYSALDVRIHREFIKLKLLDRGCILNKNVAKMQKNRARF